MSALVLSAALALLVPAAVYCWWRSAEHLRRERVARLRRTARTKAIVREYDAHRAMLAGKRTRWQ